MNIKTSELTGAALDWAVCEATGLLAAYTQFRTGKNFLKVWGVAKNAHLHPSTNWSHGGPIIEREKIQLHIDTLGNHFAVLWIKGIGYGPRMDGPDPLIAAMRCYVASKLGDEVVVPEGLG